jgi:hypothetical protein
MIVLCPLAIHGMDEKKQIVDLVQFEKEPVWRMAFGEMKETAHQAELQKYDVVPTVIQRFMEANADKMDLDFDLKTVRNPLVATLSTLKKESPQEYQKYVCAMVYCAKGLQFIARNQLDVWPINKEHYDIFKNFVIAVRTTSIEVAKDALAAQKRIAEAYN